VDPDWSERKAEGAVIGFGFDAKGIADDVINLSIFCDD
jgi:hypothetical protein